MAELELINQLKALKGAGAPDVGFVKRGRNVLMAEIVTPRDEREVFVPRVFYWFQTLHFQTVAVSVFAFLMVAGGIAAARETHQSLPGDRLYVVKRTAFQASRLIPRSEQARLESDFQFVNRTIDELKFVATKEVRNPEAYKAVVADTANDVKKFHQKLSEAQQKNGRHVTSVAQRVAKGSNILIQNLDAVAEDVPDVAREVADARVSVQQADVTALKVVAETASENPSTGEELKDMVQQRLLALAQQAAELQNRDPEGVAALEPVHEDIKAAQSLVLGGQYQAAVGRVDTALAYLTQRQRALLEKGGGKVISVPLDGEVKGAKTSEVVPASDVLEGLGESQGATSTRSAAPEVIKEPTTTITVKTVKPVETPAPAAVEEDEVEFSIGE